MKKTYKLTNLQTHKLRGGFTLIETLFAIFIFATSLVVLITVTSQGTNRASYAKNKFVASFLAQEGIELVRNIRDEYLLYGPNGVQSLDWTLFLDDIADSCSAGNGGCAIDGSDADPEAISCGGQCDDLSLSSNGFYNYRFGPNTNFNRKIEIEILGIGEEIRVTSTVTWERGISTQIVAVNANLTSWIQPVNQQGL